MSDAQRKCINCRNYVYGKGCTKELIISQAQKETLAKVVAVLMSDQDLFNETRCKFWKRRWKDGVPA